MATRKAQTVAELLAPEETPQARRTFQGMSARELVEELTTWVPAHALEYRQVGRIANYSGGFKAMFVTYVEAWFIREQLDGVLPGRWTLLVEPFGQPLKDMDGEEVFAVRGRIGLQADDGEWVWREDFGQGSDLKAASTDAFKRAAGRWGIAGELWKLPRLWVKMDGDKKGAKPVETPHSVLVRELQKTDQEHAKWLGAKVVDPEESNRAAAELRSAMEHPIWTEAERAKVRSWLSEAVREASDIRKRTDRATQEIAKRVEEERKILTGKAPGDNAAAAA